MPRNPSSDWIRLANDSYWLWADSMMVMGLRTAEMLTGRGTAAENVLMVSEKMQAAAELSVKLASGGFIASPERQAHAAVRHYRRKVSANRRRLTGRALKS